LVFAVELRWADQKALLFSKIFKSIGPDIGLKTAFTAVKGAAMDTTVEVTDGGVLLSAVADLAMGVTLVLCPALAKRESRKLKTLGNPHLVQIELGQIGRRHRANSKYLL
jgi:hypothetical protein